MHGLLTGQHALPVQFECMADMKGDSRRGARSLLAVAAVTAATAAAAGWSVDGSLNKYLTNKRSQEKVYTVYFGISSV